MIAVNLAICASVFSFFFGKKDFSAEQKEESRLIGASYMTMNNEFYKIISEEVSYPHWQKGGGCDLSVVKWREGGGCPDTGGVNHERECRGIWN